MPVTPPGSRLLRRLSGGVLDAALSSLATFLTGLAASHYFTPALLGVYALAATAAGVGIVFPAIIIFATVEKDNTALNAHPGDRLAVLPRSVRSGLLVAAPAGLFAELIFIAVAPRSVPYGDRLGLAVTLATFSGISPVQDHVRRTLHNARRSYAAAGVSAVQVVTVAIVLGLSIGLHKAGDGAVPLLALTIANIASVLAAIILMRSGGSDEQAPVTITTSPRRCFVTSRWLLLSTLVTFGSGFGVVSIITAGSSSVATGETEAARLVAQPITLVVYGVSVVLVAEVISLVKAQQRRELRQLFTRFVFGVLVLVAVWYAVAGRPWSFSPIPDLLPPAYVQLAPLGVIIAGEALRYASLIFSQFGLISGRTRLLALMTSGVSLASVGAAVLLRTHGEAGFAALNLATAVADISVGLYLFRIVMPPPSRRRNPISADRVNSP